MVDIGKEAFGVLTLFNSSILSQEDNLAFEPEKEESSIIYWSFFTPSGINSRQSSPKTTDSSILKVESASQGQSVRPVHTSVGFRFSLTRLAEKKVVDKS